MQSIIKLGLGGWTAMTNSCHMLDSIVVVQYGERLALHCIGKCIVFFFLNIKIIKMKTCLTSHMDFHVSVMKQLL